VSLSQSFFAQHPAWTAKPEGTRGMWKERVAHMTAEYIGLTEAASCWAPGGCCHLHWRGGQMGNESTFEQLQFTAQYYPV